MKYAYIFLLPLLVSCMGGHDSEGRDFAPQVLAVEGIATDNYTLYQGDTLTLEPRVTVSAGATAADYDYRWLVGKSELAGEGLRLCWPVSLPRGYAMGAQVPGVFVARERATGLEYRQTFTFTVLGAYTPAYAVVYEPADGGPVEWMSLQGKPERFTRWFAGMTRRINPTEPIEGHYRGAMYSTGELAVFTDAAPHYGRCVSTRNADPDEGFLHNVGEYTGAVHGSIYLGSSPALDIRDVTFGYGASKYFISNGILHVFNGLDRKLPVYSEQTFVKARGVRQAMSSKQFQRYKKCTFVLADDGTLSCFHTYDDQLDHILADGQPLSLDSLHGCFTEATGLGSNQDYTIYLVGSRGGEYAMYQFQVRYVKRVVQPVALLRRMPIDAALAASVTCWWGSFGETYAFYTDGHDIRRFDYYEMEAFRPEEATVIFTAPAGDEILDVYPQISGSGLRDEDYCTVIVTYSPRRHASTLHVIEAVSGRAIATYPDIVPGKARWFGKTA